MIYYILCIFFFAGTLKKSDTSKFVLTVIASAEGSLPAQLNVSLTVLDFVLRPETFIGMYCSIIFIMSAYICLSPQPIQSFQLSQIEATGRI